MNWEQVAAFIGINVALFGAMGALIIWTVTKHDAEIKSIANRLDGHAARIDQLYQMFCDLLKESRK